MWLLESAVSSSGEITSSIEKISDVFTTYTEFPSHGFNQLYKAQRYGKWFVLKGLKPEHQQETVYKRLLVKEFELGVQMVIVCRVIHGLQPLVAGTFLYV